MTARVIGLARGLHREARGQLRLAHDQGRGGRLGPDAARRILLIMLGLMSIGVAAFVVPMAGKPWLAASLLVVCQGGAVMMSAGRDAVPLILGQEDHRVLGWWPVSERELLLARGALLLLTVLESAAAMVAIPLIALMVAGRPPVLAGLGALVGVALHGVVLTALLTVGIQGLARLLGRARARRLVEVVGTLLIVVVINVVVRTFGRLLPGLDLENGWILVLAPPGWFGAWAALWSPGWPVATAALLGVASAVVLPVLGARALASSGRGDREPVVVRRRRGPDWTRPFEWWLAPWLTGRDGRALQLLVRAHLREDWRFTSALVFFPVLMLVYVVMVGGRFSGGMPGMMAVPMLVGRLGLWMAVLGISLGSAFSMSAESDAAWVVGCGVGDGWRLLALQRRMARMLLPVPLLFAIGVVLLVTGMVPAGDLPAVLAVPWLVFETMLSLMQWAVPAAPFSLAWRRDGGRSNRPLFWLMILVWPVFMVWNEMVIEGQEHGVLITLAALAVLLAGLRALTRRWVRRQGLIGLAPRRS